MVDRLLITPYVDFWGRFQDVQRDFDEANREYYKNLNWALDISEGQFKDCDIRAIPARLIKGDPTTLSQSRNEIGLPVTGALTFLILWILGYIPE